MYIRTQNTHTMENVFGQPYNVNELRIQDVDYQTVVCSSYGDHEEEEFKIEYWGQAIETVATIRQRTTLSVRDVERFFSERRGVQVKLPNLVRILEVLRLRGFITYSSGSDWYSDATRGMLRSMASWVRYSVLPMKASSDHFIVIPVVHLLIDKVIEKFESDPFLFDHVVSMGISKQDADIVMATLLRTHQEARPFEVMCGTRQLRGIKIGSGLREEDTAYVMQKFAANELQRREDRLAERVIALDQKLRSMVKLKQPKELILLELRTKKMLLKELEKLKVLSLQIQQAEHNLHESQAMGSVLDALNIVTQVAKANINIDEAEKIMTSKAEVEEMQNELNELLKTDDSKEAEEAEALIAEAELDRATKEIAALPLVLGQQRNNDGGKISAGEPPRRRSAPGTCSNIALEREAYGDTQNSGQRWQTLSLLGTGEAQVGAHGSLFQGTPHLRRNQQQQRQQQHDVRTPGSFFGQDVALDKGGNNNMGQNPLTLTPAVPPPIRPLNLSSLSDIPRRVLQDQEEDLTHGESGRRAQQGYAAMDTS